MFCVVGLTSTMVLRLPQGSPTMAISLQEPSKTSSPDLLIRVVSMWTEGLAGIATAYLWWVSNLPADTSCWFISPCFSLLVTHVSVAFIPGIVAKRNSSSLSSVFLWLCVWWVQELPTGHLHSVCCCEPVFIWYIFQKLVFCSFF